MKYMRVVWLSLSLAVGVGVGAVLRVGAQDGAEQRIPYTDAEAVARGEGLYAEYCASCHGADLEGQPNWRERGDDGLLPAPPHDETGHTWHHPDGQLFDLTKYGVTEVLARRGMSYDSAMPGFADQMTDQEIWDVLAFIKAQWPAEVIGMHDEIGAGE